jgi:histidyl-tRNA synthetase
MQFDADTVGTDSVAADAEMCMLAADTMKALGLKDGSVVKINNRKVLDGVMEANRLGGEANVGKRLTVLRAIDKWDRLGIKGVEQLLGKGRKDESGDFTKGAELDDQQIKQILSYLSSRYAVMGAGDDAKGWYASFDAWRSVVGDSEIGQEGIDELEQIANLLWASEYRYDQMSFDPSIVRGLEYYTGPVFEVDLTLEVTSDSDEAMRMGSVGSGGRYDDLVARFTGQRVPATGFSIGVSRLQAALTALGRTGPAAAGPVIVTVMEKDRIADYQKLVQTLRSNDIRAELYLGNPKKFGKQLEYADKRGSPCVVIQGPDEREKGEVTLKDLIEGAKAAAAIKDNKEWKETRPAQVSVKESDLVSEVRKILARYKS